MHQGDKQVIAIPPGALTGTAKIRGVVEAFMQRTPLPIGPRQKFAMLPIRFITDLYQLLLESRKLNFIDFSDLRFSTNADISTEDGLRAVYKEEYRNWRNQASASDRRITVLIQHDSDDGPKETEYLCTLESELGIKSTTAVFANKMGHDGRCSTYGIDYALLRRLQVERGMCFAYHCNAAELASYDSSRVASVFNSDIEFLENQGLVIKFFSPHGGVVGPDGRNNHSYYYPEFSRRRLLWTHNRFAPSGTRYSDGSWLGRIRKLDSGLDLRGFLVSQLAKPNPHTNRLFMLIHPQYYFAIDSVAAEEHFPTNPWLREFWDLYSRGASAAFWEPVRAALRAVEV